MTPPYVSDDAEQLGLSSTAYGSENEMLNTYLPHLAIPLRFTKEKWKHMSTKRLV